MTYPMHLAALRDEAMQTSCEAWAIRCRWQLAPGIDRAGPCPLCGGRDRFAIHTTKNIFLCRRCGISGVGVIDLVMKVQGVEFIRACEIVTGRTADQPVDPERAARLAREAEAKNRQREKEAQQHREKARADGYGLWRSAGRIDWTAESPGRLYLERRGVDVARVLAQAPGAFACLRLIESLPWVEKQGNDWVTLAVSMALIAAIQQPDGRFGGAHRSWLDFARPKGRLILPDRPDGKPRATKKVLGIQKASAIRLYTPQNPRRMVAGEGIETTAAVLCHAFEPDTAYWALINLGNMGGRALRDAAGKIVHDQPDMEDAEAFVPPEWCAELVYLTDGDPAESRIVEKLTRGLRRAMRLRPGLVARRVPAPAPGADMGDLAMAMMAASEGIEA